MDPLEQIARKYAAKEAQGFELPPMPDGVRPPEIKFRSKPVPVVKLPAKRFYAKGECLRCGKRAEVDFCRRCVNSMKYPSETYERALERMRENFSRGDRTT